MLRLLSFLSISRLQKDPLRAILLLFSVALGSAIFLAVLHASHASVESFSRARILLGTEYPFEIRAQEGYLTESDLQNLPRLLTQEFELTAALSVPALYSTSTGEESPLRLLGLLPLNMNKKKPAEEALISFDLREIISTEESTTFVVHDTLFTTRVSAADNRSLPARTAIVPLASLQATLGLRGRIDRLLLAPKNPTAKLTEQALLLQSLLENNILWRDLKLESAASKEQRAKALLQAFQTNILIMVGLALLISTYGVYNSAQLTFLACKDELITLRTVGLSGKNGAFLFCLEFAVLGALGALLGLSLGYPLTARVAKEFGSAVSAHYFDAVSQERLSLLSTPSLYLLVFFVSAGICALGAAPAARRVAALPPRLAHRKSQEKQRAASSRPALLFASVVAVTAWLCLLVGEEKQSLFYSYSAAFLLLALIPLLSKPFLQCSLSLWPKLFSRGLTLTVSLAQVKGALKTSSIAIAASALSVSLLVSLAVMVRSFENGLEQWMSQRLQADVFVTTRNQGSLTQPAFLHSDSVIQLLQSAHIADAFLYAQLPSTFRGEFILVAGATLPVAKKYHTHEILSGRFSLPALEKGEEVLISEAASRKLRISVGDTIPLGGKWFRIGGVFREYTTEQPLFLFSREIFQKVFDFPHVTSISLYADKRSSSDELLDAVLSNTQSSVLSIITQPELREEIRNIFRDTFSITRIVRALVVLILFFGLLVSALQIVWFRRRELGTLRLLGFRRQTLQKTLLFEGVILLPPALLLGTGVGVGLAWILVRHINPFAFGWSFPFTVSSFDLTLPALVLFGTCLIVFTVPFRRIATFIEKAKLTDE